MKLTYIARQLDGLELAASMDEPKELRRYQLEAKKIFKQLAVEVSDPSAPNKCSIESEEYVFHYMVVDGVVYLTLTEKTYPRRLAYSYLEELQAEFAAVNGDRVAGASRPYEFIAFDTFISKTKRSYANARSAKNLDRLNENLADVQRIMTKNIQDVLHRGEAIAAVSEKSSRLSAESRLYAKKARKLNLLAAWQKYGPLVVVAAIILFLIWYRFF